MLFQIEQKLIGIVLVNSCTSFSCVSFVKTH